MTDFQLFSFRLDLLLRLIDTTTGRLIPERNVQILKNGRPLSSMTKEPGQYLLVNEAREDFAVTVRVAGYAPKTQQISYETLDKAIPTADLHLIPDDRSDAMGWCYTLKGQLDGITAIDAVRSGNSPCHARGFDERKRILSIFNPHHLEMNHVFYGLLHPDQGLYERFEIVKRISDLEYKLGKRLERDFESHFPISRIVFGEVMPDGRYLLRVINDSSEAKWLVRFEVNGAEQFRLVDFKQPETMQITKEAV